MRSLIGIFTITILSLTSWQCATADLVNLTFDDLDLNNGDFIPQSYGDNEYFDVTYILRNDFGNSSISGLDEGRLKFVQSQGDLQNLVRGGNRFNNPPGHAEIWLKSYSSQPITLNSFDAANQIGTASVYTFRVYDEQFSMLWEFQSGIANLGHTHIPVGISGTSLRLQWNSPWFIALDNISITAVPEPNALVLLLCSFGTIAVFSRNRITMRSTEVAV